MKELEAFKIVEAVLKTLRGLLFCAESCGAGINWVDSNETKAQTGRCTNSF